jgi:uncharacterized tellurite resistance protein B-like protein
MFDVFKKNNQSKKNSHLKNLVVLAKLDGYVSKEELSFLIKVGEKNGISANDIRKMISRTTTVKVEKPETDDERFEIIFDLIQMVLADGVMDESEIDYAIDMAVKLGFRPAISGVLVRKIAIDLIEGLSKEEIKNRVTNFLNMKAQNSKI